MDLERIRALAELMQETGLASLELTEGDSSVKLARQNAATMVAAPAVAPAPQHSAADAAPAAPVVDANTLTAPLVGCVYLAPEPDAEPFVAVGSSVKQGQVLCIVEAMKVMNEFLAPRDGVIDAVCVENGDLVEYGQPLFRLR